jgi:hypothetical protein
MQANRETSALLSSLMAPGDNFFQAPSPRAAMYQEQSTPRRPSLALLESVQAGKATSALLSSVMGPAPGIRSFDSPAAMKNQGNAVFANPQAALTNAEDIIRAVGKGQPWIQDGGVAHLAYLMETQAQRQVDQRSMGGNLMHEWFA